MNPQHLKVKIQAVLCGRSEASEMQKRAIALEHYKLCADAETQLEHCVALLRAGREYPALQVAESSDLLDRLNALLFPELGQWRDFCAAHNLPVPPPFDDEQISLVNSLYSKGVSQNHPLYRDYRRAMRLRRYPEALAVIKTISKINAYDAEARREYDRLRKRVADGRLALLERALRREDAETASKLCGELEADAELLADNPVWLEAAKFNRRRQSELERARRAGVGCIFKKTDSALRGNIGAELSAVLKASGRKYLPFLPAFPQAGRITREGVHYVDGVPVTESPFGTDPFEPVKHASVTGLIAEQSEAPAKSFPALAEGDRVPQEEGILVFDAADTDDLLRTGRKT